MPQCTKICTIWHEYYSRILSHFKTVDSNNGFATLKSSHTSFKKAWVTKGKGLATFHNYPGFNNHNSINYYDVGNVESENMVCLSLVWVELGKHTDFWNKINVFLSGIRVSFMVKSIPRLGFPMRKNCAIRAQKLLCSWLFFLYKFKNHLVACHNKKSYW